MVNTQSPRVAVIATGSELLRGRGTDTHLAAFARALEAIGLEVRFHSSCGDDFGRLVDEIKLALSRADIVLLSGGLGPTTDDLTREAAAEAFHRPLKFRPKLWKEIQARFKAFKIKISINNRRQAEAPEGAVTLPNPNGSAPGFAIQERGTLFCALPGPPREMIPMLHDHVIPLIQKTFRPRKEFDLYEAQAIGIPEGAVDEAISRIAAKHKTTYGITVKSLTTNICVRAEGPGRGRRLKAVARDFRKAMGRHWLGDGDLPLEQRIVNRLIQAKATIAIAESCTGGLISHRLTEIPGASVVLVESCVTYANRSKLYRLGINATTLQEFGAVSEECAREMAEGIVRTSGAKLGLAVTGIAGPTGGTPAKPVGLVYHAVHYRGRTEVARRVFAGDRSRIKERAANFALDMVRRTLSP